MDKVTKMAVERVEQSGIMFLDEVDKIVGSETPHGPDVSREGVQRDLLPIVEGSTVNTKYGIVKTDHILFIAAGAFSSTKPSDLVSELQGRFPIRVELDSLGKEDFVRILTEPYNALIKQYKEMLATEGVKTIFTDDAIAEIAEVAALVNDQTENIGGQEALYDHGNPSGRDFFRCARSEGEGNQNRCGICERQVVRHRGG